MTELQSFMLATVFGCSCGYLISGIVLAVLNIIDIIKRKRKNRGDQK